MMRKVLKKLVTPDFFAYDEQFHRCDCTYLFNFCTESNKYNASKYLHNEIKWYVHVSREFASIFI